MIYSPQNSGTSRAVVIIVGTAHEPDSSAWAANGAGRVTQTRRNSVERLKTAPSRTRDPGRGRTIVSAKRRFARRLSVLGGIGSSLARILSGACTATASQ